MLGRRARGGAAGVRGDPVEQAVLPPGHPALARRRSGPAHAPARAPARSQRALDASLQRRRALGARQVGVPVVCRLGPGLPHHRPRADRSGLRQVTADPLPARVVHAPQRPDPGLRVGLRRRQSAGARVGRLARLQDRSPRDRRGRPRLSREGLPEAAAELHVVGEPQGHRGQERLRGRLSRARQHRRLRPLGTAAHRRPHRAVGRHIVDGDVLPQHARHRAGALPVEPGVRGHCLEVLRALRLHRPGHERPRRRGPHAVGRGGWLLL